MKMNFKSILSAASIMMLLASCAKEMTPSTGDGSALVFSATTAATKTTIENGTGNERIVKWAAGDEASIWWDGGSTESYAASAGTTTTFSFVGAEGDATYYAAYPGSAATAFAGDSLTIAVSDKQDGAFASANIAVATSTSAAKNFPFYNATALVKFNVGSAEYTKAVFRGANGENLTGSYAVKFTGAGITVGTVTSAGTSVEIDLNGAGTYYFSVLPDVALPDGFSIALYKDGEAVPAASLAKNLELNRSVITDLGNIDGRVRSDYFVTVAGAGKKNGSSWENALGVSELREMLIQPLDGNGSQDTGKASYKASRLNGATFHMAAGDYHIAGEATHIKVEFSHYETPVKVAFLGGYPAGLTGTDLNGRSADNKTAFTGNKQSGIFTFGNQIDFSFDKVDFKDVKTNTGSVVAIYAASGQTGTCDLAFTNCSFLDNIQTEKSQTGATITTGKANVTVDNCYFSGNEARNAPAVNAGANSVVTISNSQFVGNKTWNTSGAVQNGGATMTVSNTLFQGNESGRDSTMYAAGGAFHGNGTNSVTTFKDCQFIENKSKVGGAISVQEAKVILEGCTFQRDTAYRNLGITSTSGADKRAGGAIFVAGSSAEITINDCDFLDNHAPYGSGGAIAVTAAKSVAINAGTTFKNNSCNYEGGAIYMLKNFTIAGTNADPVLFENNKTTHTGNQVGNGGAIWLNEGTTSTVRYARFVDNCAGVGNSFSNGGGIYMKGVTKFLAENCYFSGNLGRNGGALNLALGGSSDCQFKNCTFENNRLDDTNKNFTGTLTSCNFHGGVAAVGYGKAQFYGCTFNNNQSTYGSGVFHINNDKSEVRCEDCTFSGNVAGASVKNGNGGVVTVEKGKFYANNCTFTNNKAVHPTDGRGGVLRMDRNGGVAEFYNCSFSKNHAKQGATLCMNGQSGNGSFLKLNNCVFTENSSGSRGSCLMSGADDVIFANRCAFYNNTTTESGNTWGIVSHGNANLCMNNCTMYGNKNTNASQGSVTQLNGDGSYLLVNNTIIGPCNHRLIRAASGGHLLTLANNILVNTAAGKDLFEVNASVTVTAVSNATSASTNVTLPAGNLTGLTESSFGGSYAATSGSTKQDVYLWNGTLEGFTATTAADIETLIKTNFNRNVSKPAVTNVGQTFFNWLTSISANELTVDGRGVARTGTMWPGAYQNN